MKLPSWISISGLLTHALVGWVLTLLGFNLVAVLAVAIAHEVGDGDLRRSAPGWPWNGLLDIVFFLPIPLLVLLR